MRIWRISRFADLNGTGGIRAGGRWHSAGRPIVYCAESVASALLERLVHLEVGALEDLPDTYRLLEVELPETVSRLALDGNTLPVDWRQDEAKTRAVGNAWLAAGQSSVLLVPSAIVPHTSNYLINPLHPDAQSLTIVSAANHPFDQRLRKAGRLGQ